MSDRVDARFRTLNWRPMVAQTPGGRSPRTLVLSSTHRSRMRIRWAKTMGARHLTHDQVCDAAAKAAAIESNHGWQPAERYAWLTEAELAARVREELVRAGCVDRAQIKLNGSGRKGKSVARLADIVVGKE